MQPKTDTNMFEIYRDLSEAFEPLSKALDVVNENLKCIEDFSKRMSLIGQSLNKFHRQTEFAELLGQNMVSRRRFRLLQARLLDNGWYLPEDLSDDLVDRIETALEDEQHSEVSSLLIAESNHRMTLIEHAVQTYWPDRQKIVIDALNATREGKHSLSIPVLIIQFEGMFIDAFADLVGKNKVLGYFWKQNTRKKQIDTYRKLIGSKPPSFDNSYKLFQCLRSEVLCGSPSIAEDTRSQEWHQRRGSDSNYGPLNRHLVLHGTDVKYPSVENSARAIMLVAYIASVRQIIAKAIAEAEQHA